MKKKLIGVVFIAMTVFIFGIALNNQLFNQSVTVLMPSNEISKYLEEMKIPSVSQDKVFKKWIGKYCSDVIEKFVNTDRKAMAYGWILPETMASTYLTEAAYQQIKELNYDAIIEDYFHDINKEKIKWICAHEYAHLMDFKMKLENEKPLYPKTLYQDMIFEGKAVCFANEIVGNFGEEYIANGTPQYDLDKYKPIMHDKRYKVTNFQEMTIASLIIQRTDVYIYGTRMVDEYINRNNYKNYKDWFYKEI